MSTQLASVSGSTLLSAPRHYSREQIALIQRTVARGTNGTEFDLFMEMCRRVGLDPFRKQVHCVIYNADKADKRQMVVITGIDGLRAIAARNGNYRPDEEEPTIYQEDELRDPARNPLGIERATVKVWKSDHTGQWHPMTGVANWEEYAPFDEEWIDDPNRPGKRCKSGKSTLDPKSNFWHRMPKLMLAKCAEANALRRGWPEDMSGLYVTEEMDGGSASAAIEALDQENRMKRVGGPSHIFQFEANGALEAVPEGSVADRVIAHLQAATAADVAWFAGINKSSLTSFWGRSKADALEIKKVMEERLRTTETETATEENTNAAV